MLGQGYGKVPLPGVRGGFASPRMLSGDCRAAKPHDNRQKKEVAPGVALRAPDIDMVLMLGRAAVSRSNGYLLNHLIPRPNTYRRVARVAATAMFSSSSRN